jgi:sulfate adenylyltransferase
MSTREARPLVTPCGGELVDLVVSAERAEELKARSAHMPSIQVSERVACDLELMATGAFSPLDRFMGAADHERVITEMRLAGGQLFPIPLTLTVGRDHELSLDGQVALRSAKNELLAVMTVEEIYEWDREEVARQVFGSEDFRHPLVSEMSRWGELNLSGAIEVVQTPPHSDFRELRMTPAEVRAQLESIGDPNVVAFQTRNPLHRVHEEIVRRAIEAVDGVLLLHPAVGMTKPGDVDHFTRVRTYRVLAEKYFEAGRALLTLLPLAMRMAGPREALWHALIRRNYGANWLIVGRDHAGPGLDSQGKPFYGPYDAQELVRKHSEEIGVGVAPFHELVYLAEEDRYEEASKVPEGARTLSISGTRVREQYLETGTRLPDWFSRPEVAEILGEAHPPRHRQGFCVWFTGLSGAGKSTTADALTVMLQEEGRQVTVLDGDVVRTHLSRGLGFSHEDRDINIRRIGFVAAEIVRHGGAVICAAVSPYRATRNDVRNMVGDDNFIEVFVDTPIGVCEQRDAKGLYAKARAGEIKGFTGIDDPYEEPTSAEVILDTVTHTPDENARRIITLLRRERLLRQGEDIEDGGDVAP